MFAISTQHRITLNLNGEDAIRTYNVTLAQLGEIRRKTLAGDVGGIELTGHGAQDGSLPDVVAIRAIAVLQHHVAPDLSTAHVDLVADAGGAIYLVDVDEPAAAWRITEHGGRRGFHSEAKDLIGGELGLDDLANGDQVALSSSIAPEPYFVRTTAVDDLVPVVRWSYGAYAGRITWLGEYADDQPKADQRPADAVRYVAGTLNVPADQLEAAPPYAEYARYEPTSSWISG